MSSTTARTLYDQTGQTLRLGELLGKGGEGAVYELASDPTRVAKLYLSPARFNVDKLAAMVAMNTGSLAKISAWPERTIHTGRGAPPIGFVMPRAQGQVLEELLGPGARKVSFPDADYQFVVRTALNLARAFATTHAAGAVIGDVKEINQFVSNAAIVTLVDTDGFQVRDPRTGRTFFTTAVTPTHQPPELQGITNFDQLTRTPDHDAFGLAVLIFQLLFMGRHPFAGIPVARVDLEIPMAIKRLQFAWAPTLNTRLLQQPPATLPLAHVGQLSALFVRAFLMTSRPSAAEWANALEGYEKQLKKCAVNPTHAYAGSSCPLCQIETEVGTLLFLGSLATAGALRTFDMVTVWSRITAVTGPGLAPPLPGLPVGTPVATAVSLGRARRQRKIAAAVVLIMAVIAGVGLYPTLGIATLWIPGAATLFGWILIAQGSEEAGMFKKGRDQARARFAALEQRWKTEAGDVDYQGKFHALQWARDELTRLDEERRTRLQRLQQTIRDVQRDHYLEAQRILRGQVSNIGPTKITTLRSFNIETAFDVTDLNLMRIPRGYNIGYKAKADLLAWRRGLESQFRFDPRKGVDPRDTAAVEREIAARRAQHEQLLRLGPAALRQISEKVPAKRAELAPQIRQAQMELAQAEANAKAAA